MINKGVPEDFNRFKFLLLRGVKIAYEQQIFKCYPRLYDLGEMG